jgi:hypothetical protein
MIIEKAVASIGRAPYAMALRAIQWSLAPLDFRDLRVWPRNSYALGTLVPLVSDLDLTIWFATDPGEKTMGRLNRALPLLKKVFPFMGEVNLYFGDEEIIFAKLVNYFELMRDPQLINLIPPWPRKNLKTEAVVYLLRHLEADLHNLMTRPQVRLKKWRQNLNKVSEVLLFDQNAELKNPNTLFKDILSFIIDLLMVEDPIQRQEITQSLESYFILKNSGASLNEMEATLNPWWLIFFPHRFCFSSKDLPLGHEKFSEIFVGQVQWEIWGIMSQMRINPQVSNYKEHLECLAGFMAARYPEASQAHFDVIRYFLR